MEPVAIPEAQQAAAVVLLQAFLLAELAALREAVVLPE